jgi:hypothetical protein
MSATEIEELAKSIFGVTFCCSDKKANSNDRTRQNIIIGNGKKAEKISMACTPVPTSQSFGHLDHDQRSFDMHMYESKKNAGSLNARVTFRGGNSVRACVAAENALVGKGNYPESGSINSSAFVPSPPIPAPSLLHHP